MINKKGKKKEKKVTPKKVETNRFEEAGKKEQFINNLIKVGKLMEKEGLKTKEARCGGRRVFFFRGDDLYNFIHENSIILSKQLNDPFFNNLKSDSDIINLTQT